MATRGLCAIAQAESLRYKLIGGLAVRRACYGVLRFIMESGAKGCEVVVSGKLRVERKVKVESNNYWPDTDQCWVEKKVASNVLFKISEILPMQMFGERDCI